MQKTPQCVTLTICPVAYLVRNYDGYSTYTGVFSVTGHGRPCRTHANVSVVTSVTNGQVWFPCTYSLRQKDHRSSDNAANTSVPGC